MTNCETVVVFVVRANDRAVSHPKICRGAIWGVIGWIFRGSRAPGAVGVTPIWGNDLIGWSHGKGD